MPYKGKWKISCQPALLMGYMNRHPPTIRSYCSSFSHITSSWSRYLLYLLKSSRRSHVDNTFSMASLHSSNDEAIQFIRGLTGYTPNDQSRLSEALQTAGYSSKDGNKDLALIGDAVIKVHHIMQGLQRHQCRGTRHLSITCRSLNWF